MTMDNFDISQYKNIYLVGIGGCSMSGLARLFMSRGIKVQGSDAKRSPFTDELEAHGVKVNFGHNAENVHGADLVVYSAAIPESNPERAEARALGIPEMERCDALGLLSSDYSQVVGVSGCHGKTTITSMLALIGEYSAVDPTVHVGGFVEFLNGGTRLGSHDTFITEACEYVESFLSLRPTIEIINNIDDDHLNYFKTIDNIVAAFKKYVALLPENGRLIACIDDTRVAGIYEEFSGKKISYGMGKNADFYPENIEYDELGCASYDLMNRGKKLCRVTLHIIGDFNILNSIAAAVTAMELGADIESITRALADFKPTRRRFEYYGESRGVKYFHDYAHHPGEIRAVLSGADKYPHKKLFVVFQCNSYSRAKTLFTGDMDCFRYADEVLVPDIFPGREKDDGTVHARDMVAAIVKSGVSARYIPDFEGIRDYLAENAHAGDLVVTLGSGDVFEKTRLLLD